MLAHCPQRVAHRTRTMRNSSVFGFRRSFLAALWLLGAAGCTDRDVVAKVGGTEIRREELALQLGKGANGAQAAAVLDRVIDRQLLAEGALDEDLDEDPRVRAQIAANTREVLAQALLARRVDQATTDEALRQRYAASKDALARRQLHLRHVTVRLPARPSAEDRIAAQLRVNRIHARLVNGEAFEDVVATSAKETGPQVDSEDLGVVREGELAEAVFAAAASLKERGYSTPIATPVGFHVFQALSKVETVVPSFEESRSRLGVEARREVETALLAELRDDVTVKRYPERLEATHPQGAPAAKSKEGR